MNAASQPIDTDLQRRRSLQRLGTMWALAATPLLGAGCGGGGGDNSTAPPPPPSPPPPPGTGPAKFSVLNGTFNSPWGMDFLPDGRLLVTERPGWMVLLSANGARSANLTGVPPVFFAGQGGLLDVAVDPDFANPGNTDNWIYMSYASGTAGANGTRVARARLSGTALTDFQVLFEQFPTTNAEAHFGSRLAFGRDKSLFVTLGERTRGAPAQDLATHFGKVVRINRSGGAAAGNPSLGAGALPEIWTYGHRNPQGIAIHPVSGEPWVTEHGPQGGDELNLARPGRNFGWPNVSYGCDYGVSPVNPACRIGGTEGRHAPTYTEPVSWWPAPSIAPSGLMFYTGDKFPEWQGNAFTGALAGKALWRIVLNGETEVSRESVFGNMGRRIRAVKQGPDGWIYLLADEGQLLRVER
jgi:glucose/arabinose dehydrogenase